MPHPCCRSDLEQYRVVTMQEGQAYARENDMMYFETSAKSGYNVRRMFVDLGEWRDGARVGRDGARVGRLGARVGRDGARAGV